MALPTIAPTNCWTKAEDGLARALADCPETWAFLGVPDAAAAADGNMWIDVWEGPRDGEEMEDIEWRQRLPAIVVGSPGDETEGFELFRRSHPNDFGAVGTIEVQFLAIPDENETEPNQERIFRNHIGTILEQMTERGDREGFTWTRRMTVQGHGREKHQQGEFDQLFCIVHFPWGDTEGGED